MASEEAIFEKTVDCWNKNIDRFWLLNFVLLITIGVPILIYNYQASYDPNKLLLRGACIIGFIATVIWIAMNLIMKEMHAKYAQKIEAAFKDFYELNAHNRNPIMYDMMNVIAIVLGVGWIFLFKFSWSL